jgi:hypothetical protein
VSLKAIVTGGAGFIGSHITDELTRCGLQVIIPDDLSAGRIENIQYLLSTSAAPSLQGSSITPRQSPDESSKSRNSSFPSPTYDLELKIYDPHCGGQWRVRWTKPRQELWLN